MHHVTQHNVDINESFTGSGVTIYAALAQAVSTGQASTRHRADDVNWMTVLADALLTTGTADRGFARYTLTSDEPSESVAVGTMSDGDTGTVADGKFQGRRFRVRHVGSQGTTVWLDWTEHGTNGVVQATTLATRDEAL